MRPELRSLVLAVVLAVLSACGAEPAAFQPAEPAARARTGNPAAAYEIRDASGAVADVLVSSLGAHAGDAGGTVVYLYFELRNRGPSAIRFDGAALELEAFGRAGQPLPRPLVVGAGPEPVEVAGNAAVDLDVGFALPAPITPADLGSLRVRWAVVHGDGRRYLQFTDFLRDEVHPTAVAYVPVFGFYDPFFDGVVVIHHHVPIRRVIIHRSPPRRPHHHR